MSGGRLSRPENDIERHRKPGSSVGCDALRYIHRNRVVPGRVAHPALISSLRASPPTGLQQECCGCAERGQHDQQRNHVVESGSCRAGERFPNLSRQSDGAARCVASNGIKRVGRKTECLHDLLDMDALAHLEEGGKQ